MYTSIQRKPKFLPPWYETFTPVNQTLNSNRPWSKSPNLMFISPLVHITLGTIYGWYGQKKDCFCM